MSSPSDFTADELRQWHRTATDLYLDFRDFSLCGFTSECTGYEFARFGKPDIHHHDYLAWLDLGIECLAGKHYIGYTWILTAPRQGGGFRSNVVSTEAVFSAFPGELRYGSRIIDRVELGDPEALLRSFDDPRILMAPDSYDAFILPLSSDDTSRRRKIAIGTDRSGNGSIVWY